MIIIISVTTVFISSRNSIDCGIIGIHIIGINVIILIVYVVCFKTIAGM